MAKTDNLTDFLQGIADAIKIKKGTTDPINAQDFETEIANLSGGESTGESLQEYLNGTIKTMTFPEGVETVETYCIYRQPELENVILPNTIKVISSSNFRDCANIKKIDISHLQLNKISYYFGCDCQQLREIVLPNTITEISGNFGENSPNLTKINIPASVKIIGSYFLTRTSGEDISLDLSNTQIVSIPSSFMHDNKCLIDIKLPNQLVKISRNAFTNCSNVQNKIIEIPATVTEIGYYGLNFGNVLGKNILVFKGETPPTTIDTYFANPNGVSEIRVPASSVETYKSKLNAIWTSLIVADHES